jgi:hypothetical protein
MGLHTTLETLGLKAVEAKLENLLETFFPRIKSERAVGAPATEPETRPPCQPSKNPP